MAAFHSVITSLIGETNFRSRKTQNGLFDILSWLVHNVYGNEISFFKILQLVSEQVIAVKFLNGAGRQFSFHFVFALEFLSQLVPKFISPLVKSQKIAKFRECLVH